jgi:hypothetical protein
MVLQIYDDYEEGQKINHWYKIDKKPAVLVVDPHTGYKMDHVEGTVDTQQLIEVCCFTDLIGFDMHSFMSVDLSQIILLHLT